MGRRPRQRHERAVAHGAGLRHLRLRRDDRPEPARLQRPGDVGPQRDRGRAPRDPARHRDRPERAGRDRAGPHRVGQRLRDEPQRGRHGRPVQQHAAQPGPQAGRGRRSRHRGLLERGREGRLDVRPHDVRGRRRPRRGPRLPGRKLARERPAVPADAPAADRQVRPRDPQSAALDPGHARRGPALRRLPRVAHRPGRSRRPVRTRRSPSSTGRRLHRADREPHRVPVGQEGPADPRREVRELPQRLDDRRTTT